MLYQGAHLVESDAATHLLLDLVNDALSRSWQVHLVPERLQRPAQKTLVAVPVRLYSIVSTCRLDLSVCVSLSLSLSLDFAAVSLPQRLDPTTGVFVRLPLKVALLLGRGAGQECHVTQACSHVTRACRTNVSRRSCSLSKTFLMVCYFPQSVETGGASSSLDRDGGDVCDASSAASYSTETQRLFAEANSTRWVFSQSIVTVCMM